MFSKLIKWSEAEFSDLPWRRKRSLYTTLVSEIMLQQTTVATVKNHFQRFLERFPDLPSLASSSEDEMLVAWKGLGYYRRARNLKKIAEVLARDYAGKFPHDLEALEEIPGIGPYTASAMVAIGMDKRALAVDANLERVIARFYGLKEPKGPKLQKEIRRLFQAGKIFPDKTLSPRGLNEALMDLGRTFCQARKASCELCPLRRKCQAFQQGSPLSIPLEAKSTMRPESHELHLLRVFVMKKNKLLVYRKNEGEWLSGQNEVPTFTLKCTDPTFTQYPQTSFSFADKTINYKTGITKYKIVNSAVVLKESEFKKLKFGREFQWVAVDEESSNLSTATVKGHLLLKKNRDQE